MTQISVQLYSVRDALATDPAGTIDRLAALGLTQVEAGQKFLGAHPELLDAIHRNGLATPTFTAPLFGKSADERAEAFALATRLGAGTVIDTFIPEEHWSSLADVEKIAGELNEAARQAAQAGLRVGYHNHWWELEKKFEDPGHGADARSAFDLLIDRLDPELVLEVDAYWVAVGGADPVDFVARHADRVRYLHLKDGPISKDNLEQRPTGQGVLPIAEIIAAAPQLEAATIEFDAFDGDVFEAIAASRAHLQGLLGAADKVGA
jgi:sugar phosphate isomerase/epimerase